MDINKKDIIRDIQDITDTEYKLDDVYNHDYIFDILNDLVNKYHEVVNEYNDYKDYVNENYTEKLVNPYEEYGVSESDFH